MSFSDSNRSSPDQLSGVVERIIYQNEENHFCIAEVVPEKDSSRVTVVGTLPNVQCGETLQMHGIWTTHKEYGKQLKVNSFKSRLPASVYGIRKYLGSGLVPGIGKTYAEKIVEKFGKNTLEIIEKDSGRLREVEGIGPKRVKEIKASWDTQRASRDIMMFLQTYGVSVNQCVRLVKAYGNQAKVTLIEDPYRIAREIDGIGFKTADKIALNLGFANESPKRIDAGLLHILKEQELEGHTGLERAQVIKYGNEILDVDEALLKPRLAELEKTKNIIPLENSDFIQLPNLALAEKRIIENLSRITNAPSCLPSIKIPPAIDWAQNRCGFEFAERQAEAIDSALASKISILTGGPGTGKTTILRSLVDILTAKKVRIALASPTGRAAQRLAESARKSASTLHRLLNFDANNGGFSYNENRPLNCDYLIIDESSMLDTWLAQAVLRALPSSAHLLLVGDSNQLPSVGCGNFLSDLIQSGKIPTLSLNKIFRQHKQSNIVTTAHGILKGDSLIPKHAKSISELDPSWDLQFLNAPNPQDTLNAIDSLIRNWIPNTLGNYNPIKDIQVLAPIHKGTGGISNLNHRLQNALNKDAKGFKFGETWFAEGDKVIQMRNNYDKGIFNGDLGFVSIVNPETGTLVVNFEGKIVELQRADLTDLSPAYAISIHKSQGSEFPVVVIPILTQHFILLQRNLIYTAITRGRKKVIIVGDPKAYQMAVRNDKQQKRFTGLSRRLSLIKGF